MPNGFSIQDLFNNLIIPFLFYQSYFEKFKKEPWKGYAHSYLGEFEHYIDHTNANTDLYMNAFDSMTTDLYKQIGKGKSFKSFMLSSICVRSLNCLCGSKKKMKHCHKRALEGYLKYKDLFKLYKKTVSRR